uniref:Uncharacterized protein n=1 Tax=Hyaloperonospora arabidopsidis (strain Emoy2) TaxID=559515 RepID=M4BJ84_HYAAE
MVMNPDCFVKGQGVYGVDAAHMKHRRYNGIKILLAEKQLRLKLHLKTQP